VFVSLRVCEFACLIVLVRLAALLSMGELVASELVYQWYHGTITMLSVELKCCATGHYCVAHTGAANCIVHPCAALLSIL
jgi:hypothetical protein